MTETGVEVEVEDGVVIEAIDTSRVDAIINLIEESHSFQSAPRVEDLIQFGILLAARLRLGPLPAVNIVE